MKRLIALLLAALMLLGISSALADTWTCPKCGRMNDGMFCPDCGTANPGSTNIQVGDYVYLGHWEQNDYTGDGAESIRWLVIDKSGSKLFLLSDKALAVLTFNKRSDGTAWAGSSLRRWLNYDFYNSAFTKDEMAAIQTTKVEDTIEHTYLEWNTASRFSGITEDKVFCLSFLEACNLLTVPQACCEPTIVVSKNKNRPLTQQIDGRATCIWWLRTSSYKKNAMTIAYNGFSSAYESHSQICVRPALWVDASAVTQ